MPSSVSFLCFFITVLVLQLARPADAHMWMQCPKPRQCFYETPLSSNDGDGEWRRKPCPFGAKNNGVTYLYRNENFCLRVREFVDHLGWIDVSIAGVPVGPGDEQSLFSTPLAYIHDEQNGTAFQQIPVTIPSNVTCNGTCTIQVRQWSDDLNWFYYACSDVVLLDRNDTQNATKMEAMGIDIETADLSEEAMCQSRISDNTCQWASGGPLLRVMILQMVVLSIAPVIVLVAAPIIIIVAFIRRPQVVAVGADSEEMASEPKGVLRTPVEGEDPAPTGEEQPQQQRHWFRGALLPLGVLIGFACVYLIVAGIVISQLKQCNYSGAYGSELSQ